MSFSMRSSDARRRATSRRFDKARRTAVTDGRARRVTEAADQPIARSKLNANIVLSSPCRPAGVPGGSLATRLNAVRASATGVLPSVASDQRMIYMRDISVVDMEPARAPPRHRPAPNLRRHRRHGLVHAGGRHRAQDAERRVDADE